MPYTSRNIQGGNLGPGDFRAANPAAVADDTSVALIVKYVGTSVSGTVEVDSNGDILFKDGALSSETASAEVDANTDGTIDVSVAAENTISEALNLINASGNWVAVAVDAVGSDTIGGSQTLLVVAATQAKVKAGIKLYWDTTARLGGTVLFAPKVLRDSIEPYQNTASSVDNMLPFKGNAARVNRLKITSTYGSGSSVNQLISDPDPTADNSVVVFSGAGGATTVEKDNDFREAPFEGELNERMLGRVVNSAAAATVLVYAQGEIARKLA